MARRVVITGMGVCAPNGINLEQFKSSMEVGTSGIRKIKKLADLNFGCQIAGMPSLPDGYLNNYFSKLQLKDLKSTGIIYGVLAGSDAWEDAGLNNNPEKPDWESGAIFGSGNLGVDKFREAIHLIDDGQVRRLGSTAVAQTMSSGVSAFLGGMLGLGNQLTTNSSACSTGTEAMIMGFERIQSGTAERMLVGSTSDSGPYVWGGFDAMRILPRKYNDDPTSASRPMSATACGFVPGSGAGALVLESLDSAQKRGAPIYAEVLGGSVNNGGQRNGGSMTAPNSEAVQRCIEQAIHIAGLDKNDIDCINGHLTATTKDAVEIENWSRALDRSGNDFPYINSFKGHLGHCLAASGSIELVACVLQLFNECVFGSLNCEDLHPDIEKVVHPHKIPKQTLECAVNVLAKASFGFGDVNACVILKKY